MKYLMDLKGTRDGRVMAITIEYCWVVAGDPNVLSFDGLALKDGS
jgi:hypothetical protein